MIRNCSLEDISDGKLYGENDMVKADTCNCTGCKSVCCYGMGSTIVLDPYDVHRLTAELQTTFEELLKDKLEINYVDKIMLPNLKMAENTGGCSFLSEEKRCAIHKARPSMCRLFPLGRYWEDEAHFKYILQTGQCKKSNLTKIKVKKWLDTPNLEQYNEYLIVWHRYIKRIEAAVSQIQQGMNVSEDGITDSKKLELAATQIKTICLYTLKTFYATPYPDEDFFESFKKRVKDAYIALGMD